MFLLCLVMPIFFLFLGCVPVSGEGEGHLAVSVHWGSQAK